ncbi:MAG: hypothetical protein ACRD9Q_03130 [Nitrososphaeraceae archaeon]
MNTMITHFFRRRWLDFRNGHGIYLALFMSFANFILIAYNFAIKQVPSLHDIFNNLIIFALFFLAVYFPTAILLGYWHRRNQFTVEAEAWLQENWIWAWISRYQIRLLQGKTTPEENDEVLKYLEFILKRHKKDRILNHELNPESEKSI